MCFSKHVNKHKHVMHDTHSLIYGGQAIKNILLGWDASSAREQSSSVQ